MSRKIKKRVSSLSYSFNRLYERISNIKPSATFLSIVVIAVAIFLFGGGLYNLVRRPLPAAYSGGSFIFLYPQLSEQFITDSIIATILYSLGIIGVIAMYLSTRYAYKPRQAYLVFIMGVALLFIAYIFLEAALQIKLG
ncbi:MAG: hypothetical protein PVF96_01210 [Candidatus Bathyarchaeota archaeon]